jgi:ribosomal protein L4
MVLSYATKLAKTPQETEEVDHLLKTAQAYVEEERLTNKSNDRPQNSTVAGRPDAQKGVPDSDVPHLKRRRELVPNGPHLFVVGILKNVNCDDSRLDLTVTSEAKTLALHSDNYYKIQFTTLNFQPKDELKPCTDLENRPAKVEYVESADKSDVPRLISIELHQ